MQWKIPHLLSPQPGACLLMICCLFAAFPPLPDWGSTKNLGVNRRYRRAGTASSHAGAPLNQSMDHEIFFSTTHIDPQVLGALQYGRVVEHSEEPRRSAWSIPEWHRADPTKGGEEQCDDTRRRRGGGCCLERNARASSMARSGRVLWICGRALRAGPRAHRTATTTLSIRI